MFRGERSRVCGSVLGAVWCVLGAPLPPGLAADAGWLVVDRDADPESFGQDSGAVFMYEDGTLVGWISSLQFVDPIRAESDDAGNLYILDASADPLNMGSATGAIFRYDTNGTLSVFAADPLTANLRDFVRADDGTLYAIGKGTTESAAGGVVYAISPAGEVSTFATGPGISDPEGIDIDGNGNLVIADRTAEVGAPGATGALFRVSATGDISVVATSYLFAEPVGVAVRPDGHSYRVLDRSADPFGIGATGAVFNVSSAGAVTVWAVDFDFNHLIDIFATADDGAVLLDTGAILGPPGASPGAVFAVSPSGGVSVALHDESAWSNTSGVCPAVAAAATGDFDGDGDVDLGDFSNFALCFAGSNQPPSGTCPPGIDADFDNDGDVDLSDFATFALGFTGS